MRIISKFRDFYDIAMHYGQDEDLVWVRETEEIKVNCSELGLKERWFCRSRFVSKSYDCEVYMKFLLLCGVKHLLHVGEIAGKFFPYEKRVICAKSLEELRVKFQKFTNEETRNSGGYFSYHDFSDRDSWLNTPSHGLHAKYDCPVICVNQGSIVKCPNLKGLGVHTLIDPYTLFQEIAMYISGVMGQKQNPMVIVSDKSKILKHGFNAKYGFRTRPKDA